MAIDFATETTLRALSPALSPLSTEVTQQQIVSVLTSATGGALLATKDNQTNGLQKTQITDGGGSVNTKALGVQVVAGDVGLVTNTVIHGVTTGGGGGYVDVKVNPSGALTVEATIASSALPTGAATETTLAAVKTSTEIMDDWDESDRAKVNPVVGQAGVQGGSGAVSANTQRVVLATDVALPTGTNTIGAVTQGTNPWIIGATEYGASAFGEFRVSSPKTLIDIVNKYGRDPEYTSTSVSGGGAVTNVTAQSVFKLAVGATNGDYAKVRTHDWLRYQTGRGQQIITTVIHADTGKTNQTRNWGYFDDNNGLGFRLKGTTLYVFRRTATGEGGGSVGSPYEEEVASASWNENTYGSLDVTKGNIYEIRFQWLGVGMVKFFINGILVHSMDHPNTLAFPYMGTGTLPLTWEVINTAASTASSMNVICGHVTSQSGQEVSRIPWALVGSAVTTAAAGELPLLSFRMKQTVNSVDNRVAVFPGAINVDNTATTAGANALIYARLNPTTLTGATWAGVVSTESAMEYDSAATVVSGGSIIDKFIVPATESVTSDSVEKIYKTITNRFGRDAYTGVSDIITISVQRISANNPTVTPEFFWGEER